MGCRCGFATSPTWRGRWQPPVRPCGSTMSRCSPRHMCVAGSVLISVNCWIDAMHSANLFAHAAQTICACGLRANGPAPSIAFMLVWMGMARRSIDSAARHHAVMNACIKLFTSVGCSYTIQCDPSGTRLMVRCGVDCSTPIKARSVSLNGSCSPQMSKLGT